MARSMVRLSGFTLTLVIVLSLVAAPTPARAFGPANAPVGPFLWNVEFFNNANLTGAPVFVRQDYFVGGNWGLYSPGPGIPADYFSGRWSTNASLAGGTYRITFVADDGVRFSIDGQVKLNTFDSPRPGETLTVDFPVTAGSHWVQIEYRENTSTAYLYFNWEQVAVTPPVPTVPPPVPTPAGPPLGTVNTTGLNVHAGPNYGSNVIELAFQGWQMTLLGRNADTTWLQVRTPTNKTGWVEVSHITTSYPVAALNVVGATTPPVKPPVVTPTYPGQRTHVVQPGETLFRIALRYGVNMYTLASINGIINLNLIYAGQVLLIP